MGIKEIILIFIILFVVSSPASSNPVNKDMVSVHVQKKSRDEGIIQHKKFSHGSSGYGGGRTTGAGANGGQSNSPTTRGSGTAAVFPAYVAAGGAAAAASRNNHRRNAATCNHHCIGLPTLIASVLVYMLVHISFVLEF